MKINDKIRYERKRNGWTQLDLVEKLSEITQLNVSERTIQRWENQVKPPKIIEIQCLSEVFRISSSELLNEEVSPLIDSDEELLNLGKDVQDYTHMNNYYDLLSLYFISPINNIDMVPRYDLELKGMNSYLSNYKNRSIFPMVYLLFEWIEQGREDDDINWIAKVKIEDDSIGTRSLLDPRLIFDTQELLLVKESLSEELYWFTNNIGQAMYEEKIANNLFGHEYVKKYRYL
ncbi:helix-turn-helix domain-containing protein [Enterococcus quebecensis]|uniref:HTH cro/C1-type domain-containing protein n=1 Tax=Enterococcus quebecensis TaxID=903983 RepID=A0A1E5GVN9_9ENTE|nr:helix-turn-helix transcriptional regulator [Enterococcus quebecensis]OEG16360.1 hypothetical protein BCR23_05580 [Enterococcus quebecensis]OJG72769.1 hypothetical protein RV12_GL000867 [Enterococcus quebecensis]